jgi:hypothetical protein
MYRRSGVQTPTTTKKKVAIMQDFLIKFTQFIKGILFLLMRVLVNYRTIDSLAIAYGKGKLTCYLGDLNAVVDVVSYP